jgi:hypothetical protein
MLRLLSMIAVNLGRVEKDEVFNRESNVVREKHVQGEIHRASLLDPSSHQM